jgi:hypothetical protein
MMRRNSALLATALALLIGGTALADFGFAKESASSPAVFWTEGDSSPAPGRPDSFADLADRLSAAVVFIKVERPRRPPSSSDRTSCPSRSALRPRKKARAASSVGRAPTRHRGRAS